MDEMYSMGSASAHEAEYGRLPAGHYKFRVRGLNVMGMLTGEGSIGECFCRPTFLENILVLGGRRDCGHGDVDWH